MKKLLVGFLLVCFCACPVLAATNSVTVSWKNPIADIEGNPLPPNAITNYQVMVAANTNMTGATKAADVPASLVAGDVVETATIQLETGQWYISIIPVDIIGQAGVMVTPIVYSVVVAPGGVRELQVVGATPVE